MRTQARQEWIERIIRNEIYVCQSMLVDRLLENGIVSYDEISNSYVDHSDEIEELEEEIETLQDEVYDLEEKLEELELEYTDLQNDYSDSDPEDEESEMNFYEFTQLIKLKQEEVEAKIEELEADISELEDRKDSLESEQYESKDIYEWWVVSNWLADLLESYGEPILRSEYETWWGRCTTGQAIQLDYIMDMLYEKFHDENDNFII